MRFRLDNRAIATLAVAGAISAAVVANSAIGFWQPSGSWSKISGYVLLVGMLGMAALPLQRSLADRTDKAHRIAHEWGGLAVVVGLFAHGPRFSAIATATMTAAMMLLAVLGALHPNALEKPSADYLRFWWRTHVVLGLALAGLSVSHVYAMLSW